MNSHSWSANHLNRQALEPGEELVRVEVDQRRLLENARAISAYGRSKGMAVMPVIKSDAYGHGMVETAQNLCRLGVRGLAVFEMGEAEALRAAGVEAEIFLLAGLLGHDPERALNARVTVGAVCFQDLDALQGRAAASSAQASIHIKVDTGMGRYGFTPEEALEIAAVAKTRWPNLEFTGLYSHMPLADEPDASENQRQMAMFSELLFQLRQRGLAPKEIHLANSAGMLALPPGPWNLARPGIALYGSGPLARHLGLEPAMRLVSRVTGLRRLPANTPVGYGHTFVTRRDSLVASIPAGYDNGYLRALSGKASVLVETKRAPVLGRICMRTIMIDVTDIPGVTVGSEVVLMGAQGRELVHPDELAALAGTISYELFCIMGRLNPRVQVAHEAGADGSEELDRCSG